MLGLKTFLEFGPLIRKTVEVMTQKQPKNDDRTHTQTKINMSLFKRAGVSVAVKERRAKYSGVYGIAEALAGANGLPVGTRVVYL